jgi:hypothetical protein
MLTFSTSLVISYIAIIFRVAYCSYTDIKNFKMIAFKLHPFLLPEAAQISPVISPRNV